MNNIPSKLKAEMAADPFYKKCCISGRLATSTKIDWHHNLRFGGKNVQEKFCILPLAKEIHDKIDYYKKKCDWIMWNRASEEEIDRYSKAENYRAVRDRLNKKYGTRG